MVEIETIVNLLTICDKIDFLAWLVELLPVFAQNDRTTNMGGEHLNVSALGHINLSISFLASAKIGHLLELIAKFANYHWNIR